MKKQRNGLRGYLLFVPFFLVFSLSPQDLNPGRQTETPVKKPGADYMSEIISRNTKPLGLTDNPTLTSLLKQPSINWAVRAAARHILD